MRIFKHEQAQFWLRTVTIAVDGLSGGWLTAGTSAIKFMATKLCGVFGGTLATNQDAEAREGGIANFRPRCHPLRPNLLCGPSGGLSSTSSGSRSKSMTRVWVLGRVLGVLFSARKIPVDVYMIFSFQICPFMLHVCEQ